MNCVVLQRLDHARVDGVDLADEADVDAPCRARRLSGSWSFWARISAAVLAGQAHGLAAGDWLIRPTMSCCTSPPSTHSTTSIVSSSVTRMPWMKWPFLPSLLSASLDLRSAAVHHHRVHAHQLEQHHVLGEVVLQRGVGHGVAAVLDDDGLAVELADVGQRLGQDLGLVARRDVAQIGVVDGRVLLMVLSGGRLAGWDQTGAILGPAKSTPCKCSTLEAVRRRGRADHRLEDGRLVVDRLGELWPPTRSNRG